MDSLNSSDKQQITSRKLAAFSYKKLFSHSIVVIDRLVVDLLIDKWSGFNASSSFRLSLHSPQVLAINIDCFRFCQVSNLMVIFCNTLERRNIYLNCIPAECFIYCPAEFRVASLILKFYLSSCHFAECNGIVHCLSVI